MHALTTRTSRIYLAIFFAAIALLGYIIISLAAHDDVPAGASNSGNTSGVNSGTPVERTTNISE